MTPNEVIDYYGGKASVVAALGVTRQAVEYWIRRQKLPFGRQWQIQVATGGRLMANFENEKETNNG